MFIETGGEVLTKVIKNIGAASVAPETPDLIQLLTELPVANDVAPIRIDADLVAAYIRATSSNSRRALIGDVRTFMHWCRSRGLVALPAAPTLIGTYLEARAAEGAAPASLGRYKASLARMHTLLGLSDPTRDLLVTLTLRGIRRTAGVGQRQARPLRFKGAVKDVHGDIPRGLSLAALLASCPDSLEGLRDAALLSVAYDTGLRASELVALTFEDMLPAIAADAGLMRIRRSKSDQEGEGATAYVSPRSMRALARWHEAADLADGALFRRVFLRQIPARGAVRGLPWARIEYGQLRHGRMPDTPPVPPGAVRTVGSKALTAGALTGIYRRATRRAYDAGFLPDLCRAELEGWVAGLSAHSTRVGLTQDLFTAGEDLAGIMDALRWKTPKMALLYNRNLAAESGAAGRVVGRL